jgi:monofunctional biosynthetic peptidoglycan transglycosylase
MKRYLKLALSLFSIAALGTAASWLLYPDVSLLKTDNPEKTALMRHREAGERNYSIRQEWVPISQVSDCLIKAVVIAEDDKFWDHRGFDFQAIGEAIAADFRERGFKRGASTITQQLAKNLYLSPSKNPVRKLREAFLAWNLERHLPKTRILELYLNIVEWGDGIYGIGTASRHYYGKRASELTPDEAVALASVLPNPRRYVPTGGSKYVENRSKIIHDIMVKRGIVALVEEETVSVTAEGGAMPDVFLSRD